MFDRMGSTQLSKFDSRREACSVAAEHARTNGPKDRAETALGTRACRGYHQARGHRVALTVEQQDATEHPHRSRETASSPRFREVLSARKGERAHPIQGSRSARSERTGAVGTLRTGTDQGKHRSNLVEQALCRFAFACLLWRR